ncbi:glycosyltransferase family 4 protein [Spirosoma sp. KCTC 42546]|uniref:glycosyltransferase family 4 protein n=1 Tax=Spirosoma sp. KCTC 42546 TaxID=2520506 RepID=UPI001157E4AD|nr:glycosyltransferase family 4 protein [Spirosoma sp. KCTC 42546]QDK79605.1 glycosyltransferase family 4 protein [Spirosoma sp. KCTC 42546]
MRILIVHNLLWAHYKSSVFQALQQLVNQRNDISVQVIQIARNERSRARLEANPEEAPPTYTYNYELLFDRYVEDISVRERTQALLRQARAYRPDVINLTGYYDPAQLLLLVWAKANGIRVVMQTESTAADQQRGGWKERVKRWVFRQCDGFFCFGSQAADYVIQLGVPASKILLRKNAVDNTALRSTFERALASRAQQQQVLGVRPNNFVFVGRLIEAKNLPMLLTSFAEASKESANGAKWGVILLGDGVEQANLTQLIHTLGLTEQVIHLPGRPWFKVPELLALSNVLVLPSRSEPWGLVVNEAMACGLPVIVSDRCGCAIDLVRNGQNGFVFDPDQPAQLTHQLVLFMDNSVDTEQMGKAAKQLIAPYAPEVVAQEMLDGFIKITN